MLYYFIVFEEHVLYCYIVFEQHVLYCYIVFEEHVLHFYIVLRSMCYIFYIFLKRLLIVRFFDVPMQNETRVNQFILFPARFISLTFIVNRACFPWSKQTAILIWTSYENKHVYHHIYQNMIDFNMGCPFREVIAGQSFLH